MNIDYELSEKECLDFLKKNLPKTTYFKKSLFTYLILSIIIIILSIIIIIPHLSIAKLIASSILILLNIAFIMKLKKILLSAFEKKFKNSIKFSTIFLYKITLNISDNILIVQSNHENISIPFEQIDCIYISNNYVFLISKISKDILIPVNVFSYMQDKTNFLNLFNKKNITIIYSFPNNYIFI